MTVKTLIEKLQKEKPYREVFVEVVTGKWTGGCSTCGYGAAWHESSKTYQPLQDVLDLETRVVLVGHEHSPDESNPLRGV